MKKLLLIFFLCCQSLFAQQKTNITDSVFLGVLDQFISELELDKQKYKLIRIDLVSYSKQSRIARVDTTKVGTIKGLSVGTAYDVSYTFFISLEVNAHTITWEPVTYYTTYREIPVLMATGFESLLKISAPNTSGLKKIVEKSSSYNLMLPPKIWLVNVKNEKVEIDKLNNQR